MSPTKTPVIEHGAVLNGDSTIFAINSTVRELHAMMLRWGYRKSEYSVEETPKLNILGEVVYEA